MKRDDLIVVRGGGDLATGVVHRLWSAGLRVLVLETAHPAAIRRQACRRQGLLFWWMPSSQRKIWAPPGRWLR